MGGGHLVVELGLGKQGQVTPLLAVWFPSQQPFFFVFVLHGRTPCAARPCLRGPPTVLPLARAVQKCSLSNVRVAVDDHPLVAFPGQPWKLPASSSRITRTWMTMTAPWTNTYTGSRWGQARMTYWTGQSPRVRGARMVKARTGCATPLPLPHRREGRCRQPSTLPQVCSFMALDVSPARPPSPLLPFGRREHSTTSSLYTLPAVF